MDLFYGHSIVYYSVYLSHEVHQDFHSSILIFFPCCIRMKRTAFIIYIYTDFIFLNHFNFLLYHFLMSAVDFISSSSVLPTTRSEKDLALACLASSNAIRILRNILSIAII